MSSCFVPFALLHTAITTHCSFLVSSVSFEHLSVEQLCLCVVSGAESAHLYNSDPSWGHAGSYERYSVWWQCHANMCQWEQAIEFIPDHWTQRHQQMLKDVTVQYTGDVPRSQEEAALRPLNGFVGEKKTFTCFLHLDNGNWNNLVLLDLKCFLL